MQARRNIGKTYFTYEFNVTVTRGHNYRLLLGVIMECNYLLFPGVIMECNYRRCNTVQQSVYQ